ncbi:hypothetical protein Syun_012061 [Stephania yunnanensis]|uniref:Uncharacterized protein n=1 Tax=Stephania yunnanensis TaxID=152371 RepID=A0AAP0PJ39_9MAGN
MVVGATHIAQLGDVSMSRGTSWPSSLSVSIVEQSSIAIVSAPAACIGGGRDLSLGNRS